MVNDKLIILEKQDKYEIYGNVSIKFFGCRLFETISKIGIIKKTKDNDYNFYLSCGLISISEQTLKEVYTLVNKLNKKK